MNDPDFQIDRMLRESPPEPLPVPGLESRIRRTVRQSANQRLHPFLPALVGAVLAAPMLMLALFVLRPKPEPPAPVASQPPTLVPPATDPAALLEEHNPLRAEALAIGNDAKRASRFLLNTLPSLADK